MLTKLAIAAAVLPLATGAAVLSADYAIVDVKDKAGMHVLVPVPLTLVQAALSLAPAKARRIEAPVELKQNLNLANALVAELRKCPDAELVSVDDGNDHVRITKAGDELLVHVEEQAGARVDVRVPLAAAADMLSQLKGDRLEPAALIDALRLAKGELVHVVDGDTEVRVRMW